jgi:guanine deaminase
MSADLRGRAVTGFALHTPERGAVEAIPEAVIALDATGAIAEVLRPGDAGHAAARREAIALRAGSILLPGMVDLHIHAAQYPQLGTALDLPLEEWLHSYTFPLEARYADTEFAGRVYGALVADLLACGTTTAVYYATIHDAATCLLADICIEAGQRAFVGRVSMDHPETCPDYYRDASAQAGIDGTRAVIAHVRGHPGNADGRVRPMITPRFIPSCTDELLAGLGALARETGVAVQTHASEGDWEHGHVIARHGMTGTASLDRFGLLPPGSVIAHGCHLSEADMRMLADRQAGVAHCPWSNAYFGGAVFPLRRALGLGVRVGLGSDISGGPLASLFETARLALAAARMLEAGTDPDLPAEARSRHAGARIDAVTAFFLATAGGGEALGLPVGRFAPGQRFDAMLLDPAAPQGMLRLWEPPEASDPARLLERLVHGTARANIAAVFVDGRPVSGAAPTA